MSRFQFGFPIKNLGLFLLMIAFMQNLGCTRKNSEKSNLQINLPQQVAQNKVGVQSGALTLGHVVINVSGPGMPGPIVINWDSDGGRTAPSSFFVEAPQGDGRLVQILAVYKDSTTSSMSFYYGDVIANFNSPDINLLIPVTAVGTSTIYDGQIAGRYLTSANDGPSGEIEIRFLPPGKPSLLIERSFMFHGWFSVFGLSGQSFSYQLKGFGELFGGPVSLDSSAFATTSNTLLKLTLPVHNRSESSNVKPENPSTYVWGYFGDSNFTSSKKICADFSTALTKMYKYGTTNTVLTAAQTTPAIADLFNTATPSGNYYWSGGVANCSSAEKAEGHTDSYLTVTSSNIDGNGKEWATGIMGALKLYSNNFLNVSSNSSNNKNVSGRILPGLAADINRVVLYKTVGPSANMEYHNFPFCPSIGNGENGYVYAGESTLTAVNAGSSFSIDSNISPSDLTNGVAGVLCFANGSQILPLGIPMRKYYFSYLGSGPAQPAPQQEMNSIEVYTFERVAQNQCQSIDIQGIYFNGSTNNSNVINSSARNFTVSTANFIPSIGFYSDASCTTNLGSNFTLPAGSVRTRIYYRIDSGSPGTGTITITDSASIMKVSNIDQNTGTTATSISFAQDSTYVGGTECRELEFYQIDSSKRTASWGNSSTWNLYLYDLFGAQISPAGVSFVDNCTSKNIINAVNIGPSAFKANFALLTVSNANLADAKIFLSPVSGLSASTAMYINPVKKFDHFDAFNYLTRSYFYDSECIKYSVTARDISNVLVSLGITLPFNLMPNGASVYTDSQCSSPWTAVHALPAAGVPEVFYVRYPAGTANLQLTSIFGAINLISNTSAVYASPATNAALLRQYYSDHMTPNLTNFTTWNNEPNSGAAMTCAGGGGGNNTPSTEALLVSTGVYMGTGSNCYSAVSISGDLTISLRARFDAGPGGDIIRFTNGSAFWFRLTIDSAGVLGGSDYFGTSIPIVGGGVNFVDGLFHNLVLVYNSTSKYYYLSIDDGAMQTLNPTPAATAILGTNNVTLGGASSLGTLMNVKALLIHNAALPGSTAGNMNDVSDINNYLNSRFP